MGEADDTNPPVAHRSLAANPRRPPAHQSVSLVHSRDLTPQPQADSQQRQKHRPQGASKSNLNASLSSLPAQTDKNVSSGESSNAEKWFEKSNNNIRTGSADLMDNDPPFFLRNSSSSETSPDMANRERENQKLLETLPHRTGLMHLGTTASSSEDFRSVIDDLTVQNKKLKRKLKKYEKLQDAHLQGDKLFEIRVHGLPAHKKRELEETLRKFAAGLEGGAPTTTTSSGLMSRVPVSLPPNMDQRLTTSSLGLADSAYASASGQQSSAQSGQGSSSTGAKRPGDLQGHSMSSAQQRDIQTYLSDIPQGLLARPVAMTEKAKRKLIVKRMEQIFAGKGASKTGHQQPLQQEEISQSAARADRSARQASGRLANKEGVREARIMKGYKRRSTGEGRVAEEPEHPEQPAPKIANKDFAVTGGADSPDQRPTRPLDLDPNRAQVPADNINYLRHLGFSPLDAGSEQELIDGHGYMYLNILINMAQLHTLNVTPEFVKKALEQYSDKLELSSDGRKVRWKGGSQLTHTSSNGSPDEHSNASGDPSSRTDTRRKGMVTSASGDGSSESYSKSGRVAQEQENKLAYVPLFFHKEEEDDSDSDDMSEWASGDQELVPADSSGLTSSGKRTTSSKKRQANDGPIIFYNKAPFVTDLSGDFRGSNVKTVNIQDYSSMQIHAVGIPPTSAPVYNESRGPLSKPGLSDFDPNAMETDETVGSESVHGFSKPASMKTTGSSSEDSPDPMEFEASGVGGVHPSDNFSLSIKTRHKLGHDMAGTSKSKNYPPHIRAILAASALTSSPSKNAAQAHTSNAEILATRRKDLPPSELPPPSYFPMSSPESDDEYSDEEDESELDATPLYGDEPAPAAAPQVLRWPINNDSGSDMEEDDDEEESGDSEDEDVASDSSDDGSIDMLKHARKLNPELIRLAEREYDSTLAERLADEIPAGSSAATAGGGSGFNSPVSPDKIHGDNQQRRTPSGKGSDSRVHGRLQQIQQPQRGILKRTRTSGEGTQQRASKSPKLEKSG